MRMRFERIGYRVPNSRQISLGQRLWIDFRGLGTLLLTWQQRARERHNLAAMSHHMRRDMGLSDADVFRELEKPFWRQ